MKIEKLQTKIITTQEWDLVVKTIEFEDICPICGKKHLEIKAGRYCYDGEFYITNNITCDNNCQFKYKELINVIDI